jgi:hypothetical protein
VLVGDFSKETTMPRFIGIIEYTMSRVIVIEGYGILGG